MEIIANIIRNRMRFLASLGDDGIGHEAWRDTNEGVLNQYFWTLDEDLNIDWPDDCRIRTNTDEAFKASSILVRCGVIEVGIKP